MIWPDQTIINGGGPSRTWFGDTLMRLKQKNPSISKVKPPCGARNSGGLAAPWAVITCQTLGYDTQVDPGFTLVNFGSSYHFPQFLGVPIILFFRLFLSRLHAQISLNARVPLNFHSFSISYYSRIISNYSRILINYSHSNLMNFVYENFFHPDLLLKQNTLL